jgi:hypothetical protein
MNSRNDPRSRKSQDFTRSESLTFFKNWLANLFYYLPAHDRERQLFEGAVEDNEYWDIDTFFEVLSWGGFKETDAFKDYYKDFNNLKDYNFYQTDFIPLWPTENCN